VNLQRPESAAEIHLLRRCDLLVAKDQYVIFKMSAMNAGEVGGAETKAEI
jgi:hypothetical protein